jgi:hypothetical protein
MMAPSLDAFIRALEEIAPKVSDKGLDTEAYLPLVTTFSSLIEAKNRALTKSITAKNQPQRPVAMPDDHAHPPLDKPAPAAPPQKE